jgi:hypothetical protein
LGRHFGIGWSHGYHAGRLDGRFQAVKDQHPASMYGSRALLYPYHPGYTPGLTGNSPPIHGFAQGQPLDTASRVQMNQAQVSWGEMYTNPLAPTVAPAIQPRPQEPSPPQARALSDDQLQSGTGDSPVELSPVEELEAVEPNDASPGDRPSIKPEDDDDLLSPSARLTPLQRYYEARQRLGSKR